MLFPVFSKSSQRAIDELQRTLTEIEMKYKAEIGRIKKKYEVEIREFEVQIDVLSRNNNELAKNNKSLATKVKVCCKAVISSNNYNRFSNPVSCYLVVNNTIDIYINIYIYIFNTPRALFADTCNYTDPS